MNESERIAMVARLLGAERTDVPVHIGDDAAVVNVPGSSLALSVDVAVDNVHFKRSWITMKALGRRAVHAAASDLAAMGAAPLFALSSLILPSSVDDEQFRQLNQGIASGAKDCGLTVIGGNLSSGDALSITTTVVGDTAHGYLTRHGGQPGDTIYLSGPVGGAALGLAFLAAGKADTPLAGGFVATWRQPAARLKLGRSLVGTATSAVDISDGLWSDLHHLCHAAGCGATLHTARLPLQPKHADACNALGLSPLQTALGGGEEYELLFTAPNRATTHDLAAVQVGQLTEERGVVRALDSRGQPLEIDAAGFDHFR